MSTIVFAVEASPDTGGGHVMRCLTLADALVALGQRCVFATHGESIRTAPPISRFPLLVIPDGEDRQAWLSANVPAETRAVVIDDYAASIAFETACRAWAGKVIVIDDLASRPHDCDLLLDQTLGREEAAYKGLVPSVCTVLTGSPWALLREQFTLRRAASLSRPRDRIARIVVALSATDPMNFTATAIAGIARSGLDVGLDVILGAAAPHLAEVRQALEAFGTGGRLLVQVEDVAEILAGADLAIGSGGVAAMERCALGVPTLLVVLAENQQAIAKAVIEAGACTSIGWWEQATPEILAETLRSLDNEQGLLARMGRAAAALCDAQGAQRTAGRIAGLL